MAYEGYNIYLQYQADTPKDYFRTTLQERINRDFLDTLNVYTVQLRDRLTNTYSDLTVRVETYGQEYSFFANDEFKKIIFQDIDYTVFTGDIFEFDGYRWMVVQAKVLESATASCVVRKCNCVLKFTETTPLTENIIEVDCVAQNKIYDSKNDVFIDLPQGTLKIQVPHDLWTMKIRVSPTPTRFLLGLQDWRDQYKAWEVDNIDTIHDVEINTYASTPSDYAGMLTIHLKESQSDRVNDNHTEGVAWQRYFDGRS